MLEQHNTGLMLIDVQGKLAQIMQQSDAMLRQTVLLLQGAKLFGLPVIWVEQCPDKLGPTHADLLPYLEGEPWVKNTFSALKTAAIKQAIHDTGRRQWLVCGIETHVCVYQTVADLLAEQYQVSLVTDAISSRSADNKALAIAQMQHMGANLTSVEMALFELQGMAAGDVFRAMAKLVK